MRDSDIPHCTSIAKAVHEKAHKVRVILKELFAVSLLTSLELKLTDMLEHPW
jgi:hypothetical protein